MFKKAIKRTFFADFESYFVRNRHFWCRGYFVSTVGANKKAIEEYIRHQLDEDEAYEQMTFKEYIDPFTGRKNT